MKLRIEPTGSPDNITYDCIEDNAFYLIEMYKHCRAIASRIVVNRVPALGTLLCTVSNMTRFWLSISVVRDSTRNLRNRVSRARTFDAVDLKPVY